MNNGIEMKSLIKFALCRTALTEIPIQLDFRVELLAALVAEEGAGLVHLLVRHHVLRAGEDLPAHVAHRRRVIVSASGSS